MAEAEDAPPDADDPGPVDGWALVAEAKDVLVAADTEGTWYPAEVLVLALLARDTVELVEVCEVGGE